MCSNISESPTQTDWFRVANGTEPSCVSSMYDAHDEAIVCEGFQSGKFDMSSNLSTIFLQIKRVNFSDSGLYFCGFYKEGKTVLVSAMKLIIQGNDEFIEKAHPDSGKKADGVTDLMSVFLGALSVFLTVVVIVLAVRIRRLQTAVKEEQPPGKSVNAASEDLIYAAVHFQAKAKRGRRPAAERQLETHVVYAATR
ncbi:uncharacterized protein ACNS7B_021566 [Menidia menidia]